MNSQEKLLTFKIKNIYGSLGYYYGFDYASDEIAKNIKEVLNEKNHKEFFLEDGQRYTIESIKPFFEETKKEWKEFYDKEIKRQKDYIEEKKIWFKTIVSSLPSVKVYVSTKHANDLAAFYSDKTYEFIEVWLAEKGYGASSVEEINDDQLDDFILLDNGKKFSITSKAKINSDGVFSYSYLEFNLEEKLT